MKGSLPSGIGISDGPVAIEASTVCRYWPVLLCCLRCAGSARCWRTDHVPSQSWSWSREATSIVASSRTGRAASKFPSADKDLRRPLVRERRHLFVQVQMRVGDWPASAEHNISRKNTRSIKECVQKLLLWILLLDRIYNTTTTTSYERLHLSRKKNLFCNKNIKYDKITNK